jgi:hypothetical protein
MYSDAGESDGLASAWEASHYVLVHEFVWVSILV